MPLLILVVCLFIVIGLYFGTVKVLKVVNKNDAKEEENEMISDKLEQINDINNAYNKVRNIKEEDVKNKRKVIDTKLNV